MPEYDFLCPNGHPCSEFTLSVQTMPSSVKCEKCGETATKRDFQAEAPTYKKVRGSGWYSMSLGRRVENTQDFNAGCKKAGLEPMGHWGNF